MGGIYDNDLPLSFLMKRADQPQPAFSAVIVTWNAWRYLSECLHSLQRQLHDLQVIVVDNASSDGTGDRLSREFPNVTFIQNSSNLGFAKANNLGIAATTGEYIFLINADVNVPQGCLAEMAHYMELHPDIGMLGPKMLGVDGRVRRSCMRFPTLWNSFCYAVALDQLFPACKPFDSFLMRAFQHDATADVDVLNGWFWVIRRQALDQVGPLDERFFIYGEDIDWCTRFHRAGWRVVFYPGAEAVHYGGASSANSPLRFYIELYRANLQYWKKYHGSFSSLIYCAITLVEQAVRLAAYAFIYLIRKSARATAAYKVRRSVACMAWLTGLLRRPTVAP